MKNPILMKRKWEKQKEILRVKEEIRREKAEICKRSSMEA